MNRRLPASADSNLDLLDCEHNFEDPLRCPCLPAVEIGWEGADGELVVGRFLHDAIAARVLRSERGHP